MCALRSWYGHTTTFLPASIAVATHKVMARHQSQSVENVRRKHKAETLYCCGLKTHAKVLANKYCCECNLKKRVQEEKCGLFGVGISSLSGVHLWWSIRGTPIFSAGSNRGLVPSIATICPTTNSSTSHTELVPLEPPVTHRDGVGLL